MMSSPTSAIIPAEKFTSLADKLKAKIKADGPLSIEAFMALALTDPDFGYYTTRDPLGKQGDFITAPEISQIFGELIGLWAVVVWQQMDKPSNLQLVELGPGRGTLMRDALRAVAVVPGFLQALDLVLVETSSALAAKQAELLQNRPAFSGGAAGGAPLWVPELDAVPALKPGSARIVIANEFLDALPIRQFVRQDKDWCERFVGVDAQGQFAPILSSEPCSAADLPDYAKPGDAAAAACEDGDIAEVNPQALQLVETLAKSAGDAPFAAIFIDYGHVESGFGDTLQALYQHKPVSVFDTPGQADVTAHVDFALLARQAQSHGLDVHGPISQSGFLMSLGLQHRCQQLIEDQPPKRAEMVVDAATRLVDPAQMGGLFKVLVLSKNLTAAPPPFDVLKDE